jgi:hypothetical protein
MEMQDSETKKELVPTEASKTVIFPNLMEFLVSTPRSLSEMIKRDNPYDERHPLKFLDVLILDEVCADSFSLISHHFFLFLLLGGYVVRWSICKRY